MTKRGDTKLLQVLVRQARENRLVYVILTEDRLVLREAQAPQPTSNIHDGRPNPMGQRNLGLGETACPGPLWVTSDKTHIEHNETAFILIADMPRDMDFCCNGP